MSTIEIIFLSFGLSVDAIAVSIACGAVSLDVRKRVLIKMAFLFGFFQAFMPLIGFFLGLGVKTFIMGIDHWIAFALLSGVGLKMILESNEKIETKNYFTAISLLMFAVATSIDALVTGITFNFVKIDIPFAIAMIGLITFTLSLLGAFLGRKIKTTSTKNMRIAGGIAIILIGAKILIDHLFKF